MAELTNQSDATLFSRHPKKTLIVTYVIVFLLLEGLLRVLAYYGFVHYAPFPVSRTFWRDINKDFGIWREPNDAYVHRLLCFEATYSSNSHGARDRERNFQSKNTKRVVVLGDSFVEGYGIEREHRMTDLLEEETGIEHLNFGLSEAGSIQEWLLYKTMASKFDHTDVFVFTLPDNDFRDNNPKGKPEKIYRPFLKKAGDSYEVYYPVPFEEGDRYRKSLSDSRVIYNRFSNNVYLLNIARRFIDAIGEEVYLNRTKTPSYNNYSEEDLDILLYTYRQIVNEAEGKNVYIFTIPRPMDFKYYQRNGYNFRLVKGLKDFTNENENAYFFDLLPYFISYAEKHGLHYKDFFMTCDGHWNNLGNRVGKEAVITYVYQRGNNDHVGNLKEYSEFKLNI